MRIERFISGAVAADGGTIACQVILDDGSKLDIGLDARIPKQKSERLVFMWPGYPTLPEARTLKKWSREERRVIKAISDYLDRTCGFLRREALYESDSADLNERDMADKMAVVLLAAILDR